MNRPLSPGLSRRPWSREDLILAWDACPKDYQRYGKHEPRVLELAQLLDRSPSAIDQIFGNFWWTWSGGTQGLRNSGSLERSVVEEFGNDPDLLAHAAHAIRRDRVRECLWPRLLIEVPEGHAGAPLSKLAPALFGIPLSPQQLYVVYRRGSLYEDIAIFFIANPAAFGLIQSATQRILTAVKKCLAGLAREKLVVESDGFRVLYKGNLARYDTIAVERYQQHGGDLQSLPGDRLERISVILSKAGELVPAIRSRSRTKPRRRRGKSSDARFD